MVMVDVSSNRSSMGPATAPAWAQQQQCSSRVIIGKAWTEGTHGAERFSSNSGAQEPALRGAAVVANMQ